MIKIIIMYIKMSSVCRFSMHVNIQRLYVTMCACGHIIFMLWMSTVAVSVMCMFAVFIYMYIVWACVELMCIIADVDHKRLVIIIQTKIIFIGPINSAL